MSPRTRVLLLFVVTIAVVSSGLGYTVARMHEWHERGWTGIAYYPAVQEPKARDPKKPDAPRELHPSQMAGKVMITYGSVASRIFQADDRVIAVNGIPVTDIERLRALDARTTRDATLTFTIRRGTRTFDAKIPLESPFRSGFVLARTLVSFVVAGVFIAVAVVVFMRRPEDRRVVVFYAFALVSAMAVLGKAATVFESAGGRGIVASLGAGDGNFGPLLFFVFPILYAPLLLHLALIFPRERPIVQRHPKLVRWIYAGAMMAGLLFAGVGILVMIFFQNLADAERAAYDVGRFGAITTRYASIAGLLLALQVIWAGRREGVIRAFANRPLRAAFSIFAFFLGAVSIIGRYGSGKVAAISGIVLIGLPMLLLLAYPVLAAIALVRSYREAGVEEKRQVKWPVWGLFIALSIKALCMFVAFGFSIAIQTMGGSPLNYRFFFQALDIIPTAISIIVPLSFAAAILKYRLMNIDVIIRRTVVYAMLSTAIVVFYLGLVGGLGTLLVTVAHVENQTLVIASTLIVALAFVPLRNKLQTLVDRNLFRHKFDYPEALRAITNEARVADDTGTFLHSVAEKLQQALQNRAIVIFIERQDDFVAAGKVGVSDTLLGRLRVPHAFADMLARPFDPRRRSLPEQAAAALARIEAALVVPAGSRAFIAAAPKLSGGELDVEDIDFLQSAAEQVDMALDRIRMQMEEADFAQARAIQQTLLPREIP
ncbi:MAG TPA: hypothetical protein VHK90_10610, partial [Thermoanaerobaculia bacterium]|nr:hypothetical protein [Thermoanaerobaculia bacterium]